MGLLLTIVFMWSTLTHPYFFFFFKKKNVFPANLDALKNSSVFTCCKTIPLPVGRSLLCRVHSVSGDSLSAYTHSCQPPCLYNNPTSLSCC